MGYFKRLLNLSSYYLIGNIIVALVGFISFPVWTRLLSKEEYGTFTLIVITILFLGSISKLGLQHSALRFFSEFKEKKAKFDLSYFYSTLLISSFFVCLFFLILFELLSFFAGKTFLDKSILSLLRVGLVIVFIDSLMSIILNFYQAEQNAKVYGLILVLGRIGRFSTSLIFVFFFLMGLYGLFIGRMIFGGIILSIIICIFICQKKLIFTSFSLNFFRKALHYSLPLIGFELATYVLALGDRYLIQYFLKAEAVGVYSAAYNLSQCIAADLLSGPLRLAVVPIYFSIWERYGDEKTCDFLNKVMNYYIIIGIPMIFGFYCLRGEIMTLLASTKFIESKDIIPFVFPGMIIYGAHFIYGAGLYIQKKTTFLFYCIIIAGVVNLTLNIILIPRLGIMGSALATLISYTLLALLIAIKSYSYLKIRIELNKVFLYLGLSVCMALIITSIGGVGLTVTIIKVVLGALFYSTALSFFDSKIRCLALSVLRWKWSSADP